MRNPSYRFGCLLLSPAKWLTQEWLYRTRDVSQIFGRSVTRSVGRLVGWGRLVGRSVGWLVCRSVGWLVGWFVGRLVGSLVGWLVGWLVSWLVGWLVSWLVGWLVGWKSYIGAESAQCCLWLRKSQSPSAVRRKFSTKCHKKSPQRMAVLVWYSRFVETGCVSDRSQASGDLVLQLRR